MPSQAKHRPLSSDRLSWTCDPASLPKVSEAARASLEIIGQDRALDALELGLDIRLPGYHIFVTGEEGTGRTTMIRRVLESRKGQGELPGDLCYVHNFLAPDQPLLLRFPPGVGRDFKRRIERMTASLRRHIPQLYRGEVYQTKVSDLEKHYRQAQGDRVQEFAEKARQAGFTLVEIQSGPYIRPELQAVVEGQEYDVSELGRLVEEGQLDQAQAHRMQALYAQLSDDLKVLIRSNSRLEDAFRDELAELAQAVIHPLIHDSIEMLKARYEDEAVNVYLAQAEEALLDETWVMEEDEEPPEFDSFERFGVNLIVDNGAREEAPVIVETTPSFHNLFGNIEPTPSPRGMPMIDYRSIKPGSLVRASGGTLVIMAQDLLEEGLVWPTLKRTLRNQRLEVQAYDPQNRMIVNPIKPESIKLDVKVILIGNTRLYNALLQGDPDLQRVFRVKVDFETDMPRNRKNLRRYISFMNKVAKQDKLLPMTPPAQAAVLEQGARLAGRQDRLSTRFSSIVNLMIESDHAARKAGAKKLGAEHVQAALSSRNRRLGLGEEHFRKMVREKTILIDTRGEAVGQVNGLFVLEQWDYAFGQPVRVTASTSLGEGDILSIEREAELSGNAFDKGHFILEGFMRHRFAQDKPLSLHAAIACEQNYVGVDGDSASVTEIFALMSALSGLPVSQSLAVTGSVNQFGEVQPVGGVVQKIEGFFQVCKEAGLTGEQGVVIPAANARDLMLNRELVAEAAAGRFHIHTIKTVDEGLSLLTRRPAGRRRKNGSWPEDSVNGRVDARLREMALTLKRFGDGAAAGS
jgi:lon-related putative ATP-dependent protease